MKRRKIFIYTGVSVLILAVLTVGGYFYAMHYYSRQIDKMMDLFLAEMLEEGSRTEQEKSEGTSSKDKPATDGTSTKQPGDTEETKSDPNSEKDKNNGTAGPVESDPDKRETESKPPSSSKQEELPKIEELENKYTPAFKKVEFKDQLFTLQMLRKFSASEIQEMFRLYEKGGKSLGVLFNKMEDKISHEEMERIIDVAKKYKGLI